MIKEILGVVLIVLLSVLLGCQADVGRGQLIPPRTDLPPVTAGRVNISEISEVDIVEQVAVNRQAYRRSLELLLQHYTRTGNNMKMEWAQKELNALNTMPQYKYIIVAETAGSDLRASVSIPEADSLYLEAVQIEKQAGPLPVVKDDNMLRLALDKYNQVVRKYPNSDKIDDAAYKAAGIYEYFKDYTIALLYYQRTYEWDPETIYPARFRAAMILDRYLHRRTEALELYQEAVIKESRHEKWKEYGEKRIRQLTGTDEGID
jgi:tetratricopeptide (TPR) repeat protein